MLRQALEEVAIAENHFNNACESHIDIAIRELNYAKENLNRVIKKVKHHV